MKRVLIGLALVLFGVAASPSWSQSRVGGTVSPDGVEVQVELPGKFHLTNRGGSDGSGLCVFASAKHASIWQNVVETERVFEYMFDKPGGAWPDKFDKIVNAMCKAKGVESPPYMHYQGNALDVLELALKTGRMPCCTYYYSPSGRYGGQGISHMVNLVHMDAKWVGVLDNNFPGTIEWIPRATFSRVFTGSNRNGWAIIFLAPGPPPPPRSRSQEG